MSEWFLTCVVNGTELLYMASFLAKSSYAKYTVHHISLASVNFFFYVGQLASYNEIFSKQLMKSLINYLTLPSQLLQFIFYDYQLQPATMSHQLAKYPCFTKASQLKSSRRQQGLQYQATTVSPKRMHHSLDITVQSLVRRNDNRFHYQSFKQLAIT